MIQIELGRKKVDKFRISHIVIPLKTFNDTHVSISNILFISKTCSPQTSLTGIRGDLMERGITYDLMSIYKFLLGVCFVQNKYRMIGTHYYHFVGVVE